MTIADDLALAVRLADEASALALQLINRGLQASSKSDGTVVTEADLLVERALTEAIVAARPGDAILGEEYGATNHASRRWILDPIDGTRNLVAGRADWGVNIALEVDGDIVVGVVTRPAQGRRWWAGRDCGAFCSDVGAGTAEPLRVSDVADLSEATMTAWLREGDLLGPRLRALSCWLEPVDLDAPLRVVEGELDALVVTVANDLWDRAPYVVLVEEAGGRYSDLGGGRDLGHSNLVLANGLIGAELDRILGPPSA